MRSTADELRTVLDESTEPIDWGRVKDKTLMAASRLKDLQKAVAKKDADESHMFVRDVLREVAAAMSYLGYTFDAEKVHDIGAKLKK